MLFITPPTLPKCSGWVYTVMSSLFPTESNSITIPIQNAATTFHQYASTNASDAKRNVNPASP